MNKSIPTKASYKQALDYYNSLPLLHCFEPDYRVDCEAVKILLME